MGDRRDAYMVLEERERDTHTHTHTHTPVGKSSFGRRRQRWDDNFKMEFQDMRWQGMD